METSSEKWYSKQWLVILLCVLFFPVGLYGLWKSDSFSKAVKIIITIIIGLATIVQISNKLDTADQSTAVSQQDSGNDSTASASGDQAKTETPAGSEYLQPTDINVDDELVGKEVLVAGVYMHMGTWDYLYDEAGSPNFIQLDISKLPKETKKSIMQNCNEGCEAKLKGVVSKEYGIIKLLVSEVIE